jgi:predicted kinase
MVIRGNSGSGKSTIARELRLRYGRGCALVEQDYLRRIVLRELDVPGGIAPGLIDRTARYALDHGYHAIVEGIFHRDRWGDMLIRLVNDHCGQSKVYYLDVCLAETLRRHQTRPQATEFTPADMRGWYRPHDVLGLPGEYVLPETTTIEEAIAFIATTAGLSLSGGVRHRAQTA